VHISEGVLSPSVLIAGAALTTAGVAVGLKNLDHEKIPATGILSAAFFVASLVHVPIGPSSVHMILNGLLGLILGWKAFPAILVGLALQALLFQFGGITTLGVNTLNMALPAVVCYYFF
jgi:cobalt/nickel transport system permease protein